MKQAHVHVGKNYLAKVSGRLVTVRINSERPQKYNSLTRRTTSGGYNATNLATGRRIAVSAARLRPLILKQPRAATAVVVVRDLDAAIKDSKTKLAALEAPKPDQWDSITYPELTTTENEEIRTARRAGFAGMFPAYPSAEVQARNTLVGARLHLEEIDVRRTGDPTDAQGDEFEPA